MQESSMMRVKNFNSKEKNCEFGACGEELKESNIMVCRFEVSIHKICEFVSQPDNQQLK